MLATRPHEAYRLPNRGAHVIMGAPVYDATMRFANMKLSQPWLVVFCLGWLLLLPGCAHPGDQTPESPLDQLNGEPTAGTGESPQFGPGDSAEAEVEAGEAEAILMAQQARVEEIRGMVVGEDYERALEEISKLEAEGPAPRIGQALEALKVAAKQDLVQSLYIDALIILDAEQVALGTPITGQLLLVNLSDKEIRIPAQDRRNKTTIQLDLHYSEFDFGGTVLRERRQHPVLLGSDVVLGPGERHAEPIVIDSLEFGPTRTNYRVYTLEALLYPSQILVGDEPFPGNLRFRPANCEVFPRNFEHLAEAPLLRLRQAVEKNSAVHVPLASALLPNESREEAIDFLLTTLRRTYGEGVSSMTRTAACVGLRIITREEIGAQPEAWLEWGSNRGKDRR